MLQDVTWRLILLMLAAFPWFQRGHVVILGWAVFVGWGGIFPIRYRQRHVTGLPIDDTPDLYSGGVGSNLYQDSGCPDWGLLSVSWGNSISSSLLPLPSKSFPVHQSLHFSAYSLTSCKYLNIPSARPSSTGSVGSLLSFCSYYSDVLSIKLAVQKYFWCFRMLYFRNHVA
jgi:hypothetical protein